MSLPYPTWNVVYGEIPAASKWSQLGSNDDALAAGTGLNDRAVTGIKIALASVLAENIDHTTFVGHQSKIQTITAVTAGNFSGTSNRSSQAAPIPAGATKALIIASVRLQSQVASANDMTSQVEVGAGGAGKVTGAGVVTGVGTFAAGMSTMLGVVTVTPNASNTFNLVCSAGQSASVSNYTCIIIPLAT